MDTLDTNTPRLLGPSMIALALVGVGCGSRAKTDSSDGPVGIEIPTGLRAPVANVQTVWTDRPITTNGPGMSAPTVRAHTTQSMFRERGLTANDEEELVKGLVDAEVETFDYTIRRFSREHFFVSYGARSGPVAYASSWRHDPSVSWRSWMMVRGDEHLQIYALVDKRGWKVRDKGGWRIVPAEHRSGPIGPPFSSDGEGFLRWRSVSFAEVPLSSFVGLFGTMHGRGLGNRTSIEHDVQLVEHSDGTTRLHAMFTRTTHVPFASSRLRSQERPRCTVPIEHRTQWTIDSRFASQIVIDSIAVGREQCCGTQTFTKVTASPLCVEGE